MTKRWQKFIQHIAAHAPMAWFLSHTLHYVDRPLLKWSRGKLCAASLIAGLPMLLLTTTGAQTRRARTTPLVGLIDGERIVLIASYYGNAHQPAWYHNLRAQPEAQVTLRGETRSYRAREAHDAEYAHYWQLAVETYVGYDAYKQRAGKRHIPIIVLKPTTKGN